MDEPERPEPEDHRSSFLAAEAMAREALLARINREKRWTALRPWLFGGATVVVVAVVAGVLLLPPPALADWNPIPTNPVDPELQSRAGELCGQQPGFPPDLPPSRVVDQRQDTAVVLFGGSESGGSGFYACTLIKADDRWRVSEPGDEIETLTISGSVDESLLAAPISRAVIVQDDGSEIEVSYEAGFFLLWYPPDVEISGDAIDFRSFSGDTILEIPVQTP